MIRGRDARELGTTGCWWGGRGKQAASREGGANRMLEVGEGQTAW